MGSFSWFRVGGSLLAALSLASVLAAGPAAAAQRSVRYTTPSACVGGETKGLNGFEPVLELGYSATVAKNQQLTLYPNKQISQGEVSGVAYYLQDGETSGNGTFKVTLSAGSVKVTGSITDLGGTFTFSFTGTTTCLLSRLDPKDLTTNPGMGFSSTAQFTSQCFIAGSDTVTGYNLSCIAKQIRDGISQREYLKPVPEGGAIRYVFGGGHGRKPGLFNKDGKAVGGLDCAGFTRIVYALGYGEDVLGPAQSKGQAKELPADAVPGGSIGDIVYWPPKTAQGNGHVGLVIGQGYMLDEPNGVDGSPPHNLRVDRISTFDTAVKHSFHYLLPQG